MPTVELQRPLIADRRRVVDFLPRAVDELAALFPTARRRDDTIGRNPGGRAFVFDERASATAWIVAQGLVALDDRGRERVVDSWRSLHVGHDVGLVVDGGCDVRVGVVLGAAAREGLLHWLPLGCLELALLDGGLFADDPAGAIALLVRPPTIWRLEDALRAEHRHPRGPRFEPRRFAAIEAHALQLLELDHLTRLAAAVRRIEAQLPLCGFPAASSTIAAGCRATEGDDGRYAAVAARQLARYASSSRVAEAVRVELLEQRSRSPA